MIVTTKPLHEIDLNTVELEIPDSYYVPVVYVCPSLHGDIQAALPRFGDAPWSKALTILFVDRLQRVYDEIGISGNFTVEHVDIPSGAPVYDGDRLVTLAEYAQTHAPSQDTHYVIHVLHERYTAEDLDVVDNKPEFKDLTVVEALRRQLAAELEDETPEWCTAITVQKLYWHTQPAQGPDLVVYDTRVPSATASDMPEALRGPLLDLWRSLTNGLTGDNRPLPGKEEEVQYLERLLSGK